MLLLYHATADENLESIEARGLRPSSIHAPTGSTITPSVFLATTPFWAAMYGGNTLLEITIRDKTRLYRSHLGDAKHERLYRGTIPSEDIRILGPAEEYLHMESDIE